MEAVLRFIEEASADPEPSEIPLAVSDDGVLAMLNSRDVVSGKALEQYDCQSDSAIDAPQVLKTRGEQRTVDRICRAARFSRASLPGYRTLGPTRLRRGEAHAILREAAEEARVPFAMLDAIALYTSGYRPGAISDSGAVGLLQVPPELTEGVAVRRLLDPRHNARIGARALARLLEREHTKVSALTIYLGGRGSLSEHGLPRDRETLWLVREVLRATELAAKTPDDAAGAEDISYVFKWLD